MEVIFPEYFHITVNISILWNWTKLLKLDFPTFFYNICKIFPCCGRGPTFLILGYWSGSRILCELVCTRAREAHAIDKGASVFYRDPVGSEREKGGSIDEASQAKLVTSISSTMA